MAGTSTSVYEFDNAVRGQHVLKVHGFHSVTKHVSASCGKTTNVMNTLYTIDCISIHKEDAHIKRDMENKLIFHNVWHYFSVY